MREGYALQCDWHKAATLPRAIRPPSEFTIVTTREMDSPTGCELIVWEDSHVVDGHCAEFSLGGAITAEARADGLAEEHAGKLRKMLRQTAWEVHRRVEGGCYRWVPISETVGEGA